jgi:hypothetical protein
MAEWGVGTQIHGWAPGNPAIVDPMMNIFGEVNELANLRFVRQ